ncbi:MAG: Sua5/YciO/YrdC/YwlC family protein [Methylohalobius sp.]|nr:Sua5/YciO/YrdC/YwlC family protein [Methylohalobius sp.]
MPWQLPSLIRHQAVRWLAQGGIIAYPTEAVYGLGCDPLNEAAVRTILSLKRRPPEKGLILIAADLSQLLPFIQIPPKEILAKVLATWPGPVTWLLYAAPWVPPWLRGEHPTLAVRVTAHPIASALCREFGRPLVSTSANPSGRPPARSPQRVRSYFRLPLLIVPGPVGGLARPTPILDPYSDQRLR